MPIKTDQLSQDSPNNRDVKESLPEIEVAAGIIWQGEQFLATQRVPPSRQAGFWEFPGGKCQPNEDPKEALRRELEEELGLKAQNIVPWLSLEHEYLSEGFKVRLHFFHVKSYLGDPQALEGQVLRWLTPKEALKLPFLAADQTILTRLNSLRIL